jgi:hypothetical protein
MEGMFIRQLFGLVIAVSWLAPIAAAVWALVTLHRIRVGLDAVRVQLESIARSVGRSG